MLYRYLKISLFIAAGLWFSCSPAENPQTGEPGESDTPEEEIPTGDTQAWKDYADGSEKNVLLDFSYAGYNHGESTPREDIYSLGYKVYNVQEYGAVPDDGQSDRQAFLDAVDAALGGKGRSFHHCRSRQGQDDRLYVRPL